MLLRFSTSNHGPFRDTAELSLVSGAASGTTAPEDDWTAATTRVAGIYGANASGKSSVLDAMKLFRSAVRFSATRWGERKHFPFRPFRLDRRTIESPSSYEVDFVASGTRYNYGFESDSDGIREEWLLSYPFKRPRTLFHRSGPSDEPTFQFSRHLRGPNSTIAKLVRGNSLYLSTAANNNHPVLTPLARDLVESFVHAEFDESDRLSRLNWTKNAIENPDILREAEVLLAMADTGITGLELSRSDMDGELRSKIERLFEILHDDRPATDHPEGVQAIVDDLQREIRFKHRSTDPETTTLGINEESSGTVSWLTIGLPALQCIKHGKTLVVDELDASLHPMLSTTLIEMFKNSEINSTGAQLVFTSHDTSFLGKSTVGALERDEVWFTEKNGAGNAELYSLYEFRARGDDNFERRYLQGRYGAVPLIDLEHVRTLMGTAR
ncbi:AAA family ATPase [Saccharomonospora iraqiensis]|uniref:AAA family ATPase n=1 Tax=Saccharomonospora iraqiensis TaxID=52698 RepID=UPI00022E7BE7|nr:ATP-binding protein [Saccharomonospora iraqiensis]